MRRTLHLLTLNGSCHFSDHFPNFWRSSWIYSLSWEVATEPNNLESSAKIFTVERSWSGMSLMYRRNSRGASTDPWGTPLFTAELPDSAPSTKTRWVRSAKNAFNHCSTIPSIPFPSISLRPAVRLWPNERPQSAHPNNGKQPICPIQLVRQQRP